MNCYQTFLLQVVEAWLGKGKLIYRPASTTNLLREDCETVITKLLTQKVVQEDFHFTPYSTITYLVAGPRMPLLQRCCIKITQELAKQNKVCRVLKS